MRPIAASLKNARLSRKRGTFPDHQLVRVDGDTVRFNQPIVINEVCLNCHGPSVGLKPGLKTLLDELYPDDKFRDFQVGDLRGAFRAEIKDDVPE
ncbi:MAG: DUF3365 domain-containing protein [Akkermansiaceae bacterium]|jgi:hypothetical protein